jgi:hypothetical protein
LRPAPTGALAAESPAGPRARLQPAVLSGGAFSPAGLEADAAIIDFPSVSASRPEAAARVVSARPDFSRVDFARPSPAS